MEYQIWAFLEKDGRGSDCIMVRVFAVGLLLRHCVAVRLLGRLGGLSY